MIIQSDRQFVVGQIHHSSSGQLERNMGGGAATQVVRGASFLVIREATELEYVAHCKEEGIKQIRISPLYPYYYEIHLD